jgi:tetratricopeptide (TPR) repeat protein
MRWLGRNELEKGDSANAIFYLNKSVSLNPFNAESYYWRGAAKKKAGMDDMAALDFKKAVMLNPYNPRYFWLEEDMTGINLETAHDYYYSAEQIMRSDPRQNPLLEQRLDQILYKCLELDPEYGEKVADLLWGYYMDSVHLEKFFNRTEYGLPGFVLFIEKNGLWRIHRRYLLKSLGSSIEAVDEDLAAHTWAAPEDLSMEGRMEQNSAIKIEWEFESTPVRLSVRARGTAAAEVYPQLLIRVDNVPVDSFAVNSASAKPFETVLHVKPGPHVLSLEFINDRYSFFSGAPFQPRRFIIDMFRPRRNAKKEDRNLWIEKTEISYPA